MSKIKIIFFLLLFTTTIPVFVNAQQYKYVVDKESNQKKKRFRIHISFRHLFKPKAERVAKRAARKDARKKRRAEKQYAKSVKKYQKAVGSPGDLTPNKKKKVYKRMKKNRKKAKRQVNGKPRDPFLKRTWNKIFHRKKLKHKPKES